MQFEVIKKCPYGHINLPSRATIYSAGYDFECAADTTIMPFGIALIPTGVKCKMDNDYYLQLAIRSSIPKKKGLILANGVGIIDADYYGNPDNDGHIMFQVYNINKQPITIKKGERIGQGVFIKYGIVDNDAAKGIRLGGFGSSDRETALKNMFAIPLASTATVVVPKQTIHEI